MNDLIKKADGFRLSVYPTPDDINAANWLIDRLTAKLTEAEAERDDLQKRNADLGEAIAYATQRFTRAEARERDAFERGFKAALEEAAGKAATQYRRDILAIPLPDK